MLGAADNGKPMAVNIAKAQADYSQPGWEIANLVTAGKRPRTKRKRLGSRWPDEESVTVTGRWRSLVMPPYKLSPALLASTPVFGEAAR